MNTELSLKYSYENDTVLPFNIKVKEGKITHHQLIRNVRYPHGVGDGDTTS